MEINFWWIAVIVLYTIIVSAHHYFIYTDRQLNISLREKNILYKFAYREYLLVSNEVKIVAGSIFACIFFFYFFFICFPASIICEVIVPGTINWFRMRNVPDENERFELELDSSIPVEEQIGAIGFKNIHFDINELKELIKDTGRKEKVSVRLIPMEQFASLNSRLSELDSRGLKLADPIHLLAFGKKFPDIWKKVRIYADGTPPNTPSGKKTLLILDDLRFEGAEKTLKRCTWDKNLRCDDYARMLAIPKDC